MKSFLMSFLCSELPWELRKSCLCCAIKIQRLTFSDHKPEILHWENIVVFRRIWCWFFLETCTLTDCLLTFHFIIEETKVEGLSFWSHPHWFEWQTWVSSSLTETHSLTITFNIQAPWYLCLFKVMGLKHFPLQYQTSELVNFNLNICLVGVSFIFTVSINFGSFILLFLPLPCNQLERHHDQNCD